MRAAVGLSLALLGCAQTVPTTFREAPSAQATVEERAILENERLEMRAAAGGAPFDRGAFRFAVEAAKRNLTAGCGKDLPARDDHMRLTLDPSGVASEAIDLSDAPPSVVECLESTFASVRIPPFHGDPIRITVLAPVGPPRASIDRALYESTAPGIFAVDVMDCPAPPDATWGHLSALFDADGLLVSVTGPRDPATTACITSRLREAVRLPPVRAGVRLVEAPYRVRWYPTRASSASNASIGSTP